MNLTLLGTGCPSVNGNRFGPSNIIFNKNTKILIDCGSGVTQRLHQAGYTGADIDLLLLTHLHSDHVIDFYQLIISSWHQYRKKAWKIIGPKGLKKFIKSTMNTWQNERKLRINFERRSSIKAFNLEVYEIQRDGNIQINDINVEYFRVDHWPVKYAFGFNFLNKGKKITISGDTKPCNNLNKHAMYADILLHEVFIREEIKPKNGMRSAETLNNVMSYHTLSTEVGKIAKKVKAKNLVLTHFVPPVFNKVNLLKKIKHDFRKNTILGKDLMTINIEGKVKKLKIPKK